MVLLLNNIAVTILKKNLPRTIQVDFFQPDFLYPLIHKIYHSLFPMIIGGLDWGWAPLHLKTQLVYILKIQACLRQHDLNVKA